MIQYSTPLPLLVADLGVGGMLVLPEQEVLVAAALVVVVAQILRVPQATHHL